MKRLTTSSILALTVALTGNASSAQSEHVQPPVEGPGFVELTANDVFATHILGVAVLAPETVVNGLHGEDADVDQGFTADHNELAGYHYVGRVTDLMLTRGGEARAVVVTRVVDAPGTATGAPAGVDPAMLQVPPAADMPLPGTMPEVAIDLDSIAFFSDPTVPELVFAVIGVSTEQFYTGPVIDRFLVDTAALGWQGGWHAGRDMMAPPAVTTPGFADIPVTEVLVDDLIGAPMFGANYEHIGSIGDVVLGPEGEASYMTVDIGGFLGFGVHEVAIGFDEITILRSATVDDLEVHISATRATLEAMPEYPG